MIKDQVCEPKSLTVYGYKGNVLAHEDNFDQNIRRKYSAPFADCHRVDLQQALLKRAEELGVDVLLNCKANMNIDFGTIKGSEPVIPVENSRGQIGDLVIGADGLWSTCRSAMLGQRDPPLPTGDLAYRIVLKIDQIEDPKLREMVQNPACRFWAGPDAHAVAYSMRGGNMYNVVLLVPDDLEEGVARTEGNIDEMKKLFEGWDPVYVPLRSACSPLNKPQALTSPA